MRIVFLTTLLVVTLFFLKVVDDSVGQQQKEVHIRAYPPMDIPYEKANALSYLNTIRSAMSLQQLREDTSLQIAAQAHADYLVLNKELSHEEIEGHQAFFGTNAVQRAFRARYDSSQVIENLSTKNEDAQSSVDSLFSAIYHRFSFLDLTIDEIGVGIQQDKREVHNSAFVYNMGNSALNTLCRKKSFDGSGQYVYNVCRDTSHKIKASTFEDARNSVKKYSPKIIVYPYENQMEVPPAFYDEVPDPLPNHEVSGFPVSIVFNDYYFKSVSIGSFKLYREDGVEVTEVLMMDKLSDPHQKFTQYQYALFPLKRLDYDTRYRVEVVYEASGKVEKKTWHFKTQTPKERLFVVEQKEAKLRIKRDKGYVIYFGPLNEHEIIHDIQFPSDVFVEFLDNHTIKVMTMGDDVDDFDIVTNTRTLHVEVE